MIEISFERYVFSVMFVAVLSTTLLFHCGKKDSPVNEASPEINSSELDIEMDNDYFCMKYAPGHNSVDTIYLEVKKDSFANGETVHVLVSDLAMTLLRLNQIKITEHSDSKTFCLSFPADSSLDVRGRRWYALRTSVKQYIILMEGLKPS